MSAPPPIRPLAFKRVDRDCDYNRKLRAGEMTGTPIYEYQVLTGSEHIASFIRSISGSKWELVDRIGRPIVKPGRNYYLHRGEECRSKDKFLAAIDELGHLIPSASQCAAWQASERRRVEREKQAAVKAKQLARVEKAGPVLLEAAQAAWNCIGELPPTQARVEVAQMLQSAIEQATGEVA